MRKIYCFVDETGQDTKGKIFIVSLVVTRKDKIILEKKLEEIEAVSGKNKLKWNRTKVSTRFIYLKLVLKELKGEKILRYSVFKDMHDYDLATIMAISKAFHFGKPKKYKSFIYIDALAKSKKQWYGAELRKLGVSTYKIQGVVKDENNSIIRLADAIAGWVRDAFDGDIPEYKKLFKTATSSKTLIEV